MAARPQHLRKIDFLRGIAILGVFLAHFIWYYFPDYAGLVPLNGQRPASKLWLLSILPRTTSWAGVTLFLLLSGFLLHVGYLKDPQQFTTRRFYSRRFWRVYPPYLLVLLAFCLFLENAIFTTREGWLTFLVHVFSLENLFPRTYFSVNPTFWCLALEVQIYVLYPVFLLGRKHWGLRRMVMLVFLVSLVWQILGRWVGGPGNSLVWSNSAFALWIIWITGSFLGEAWYEGRRLREMLDRRDRLVILILLILAGILAPANAFFQYVAGIIGVLLMNALLHAGNLTLQSWPARIIVLIGLFSFSLFLIHQPLLRVMIDFLDAHLPRYRGSRLVNGALVSLTLCFVSYGMYLFIELPSIRLGNRLRTTPAQERLRRSQ
jgi:peptidoglycan/LPS O-acetylase OafA/YrhL